MLQSRRTERIINSISTHPVCNYIFMIFFFYFFFIMQSTADDNGIIIKFELRRQKSRSNESVQADKLKLLKILTFWHNDKWQLSLGHVIFSLFSPKDLKSKNAGKFPGDNVNYHKNYPLYVFTYLRNVMMRIITNC